MEKIHVLVQSKKEYDAEQRDYINSRLKFFWWFISSCLFASLFYFISGSFEYAWYSVWVFMAIFMIADLSKNQKIKAYTHTFLGILYFIWGIIFVLVAFFILKVEDGMILPLIFACIFFWIAYKKIRDYTNLFKVLFNLKLKRNSVKKINKNQSQNTTTKVIKGSQHKPQNKPTRRSNESRYNGNKNGRRTSRRTNKNGYTKKPYNKEHRKTKNRPKRRNNHRKGTRRRR